MCDVIKKVAPRFLKNFDFIIKNTKCGGIMIWLMDIFNSKHNEPLFNYVDQIMANIDHLPTPGWHWWRNFILQL